MIGFLVVPACAHGEFLGPGGLSRASVKDATMKLAILDDLFDTLRGLPCFSKLDGLDVTVFADHLPEVSALVTPHIGFVTEDEFELQFTDIFDQVVAYGKGAPIHMINPEAWT